MKKQKTRFIEALCYILLLTVATLLIFTRILPSWIEFKGDYWVKTIEILGIVQNATFVLLACVGAFAFTQNKSKAWLILYIVCTIVCVTSIIVPLL